MTALQTTPSTGRPKGADRIIYLNFCDRQIELVKECLLLLNGRCRGGIFAAFGRHATWNHQDIIFVRRCHKQRF